MQTLFIYPEGRQGFVPKDLEDELRSIDGTDNINGENLSDSPVACDYKFGDDWTTIRLSDDLTTITMRGIGDATLHMALELQKRSKQSLRVFDDGYNFHFALKDVSSSRELKQKIQNSYFDAEALRMQSEAKAG